MRALLIGEFRVDIKRSEVQHLDKTFSLEPKLLQVLLLLAKKPRDIVTHQELLEAVWPGVVIEANTLQRSIAKLRKAFNDDAKTQAVISTHPKQGYSLVANILWEASDIETEALAAKTIEKTFPNKYAFPVICLVALVIIISSVLVFKPQTKTDLFKKITPLRAQIIGNTS